MSDDGKCYAATPAATLEEHILNSNIAKSDTEWWAHHEITRLRADLAAALAECERLNKSRNQWGKKYNDCLAKLRLAVMSDSDECKELTAQNNNLRAALAAVTAEQDALAAHLAPVDDDILREIAAMHFARIDGHSDNWDRYVDEAKDYIDAIRPHIEAAERERCAKIAEGSFYFDIETCLNSTKKEMTAHVAKAIAAAIRSGK